MRFIADLHIHSRYSMACSKDLTPENIWRWGQLKGVKVIGTGDFTHPEWLRELERKLEPAGNGLLKLKKEFETEDVPDSCRDEVYFALSAEISCIYRKGGRTRKIHSVIVVPDIRDAARLNGVLEKIGNLRANGRPVLGLDAEELLRIVLENCSSPLFFPAHAWTPHFSVFGAASGFDSLEECFGELTPHIYAIETGLSSNPPMNRRLSSLDRITLLSGSDAHSAAKIGREATLFECEPSYGGIIDAISTGKGLAGTIEFFPEEGKYYFDGHRACGVTLSPKESTGLHDLCPVCGKRLTMGVLHRIESLADREEVYVAAGFPPFYSLAPLAEIIAGTLKVGANSKRVSRAYMKAIEMLGNEFHILMDAPIGEIARACPPLVGEAVARVRAGDVDITPGFDGEFGKLRIFKG
jgi:uncharacterized protein (TIGR00375 family)